MKSNKDYIISKLTEVLPECIYDSSSMEYNPLTLTEVKNLIKDSAVDALRDCDVDMVVNLLVAYTFVAQQATKTTMPIKDILFTIHTMLGAGFIDGLGRLRTNSITIKGTVSYVPYKYPELPDLFDKYFPKSIAELASLDNILELYCRLVYCQFFSDCNNRTAKLFTNYLMIILGYGLFTIPCALHEVYRNLKLDMFDSGDFTVMKNFLRENCVMLIEDNEVTQDFAKGFDPELTETTNM